MAHWPNQVVACFCMTPELGILLTFVKGFRNKEGGGRERKKKKRDKEKKGKEEERREGRGRKGKKERNEERNRTYTACRT